MQNFRKSFVAQINDTNTALKMSHSVIHENEYHLWNDSTE
jgi:hypothetical protein